MRLLFAILLAFGATFAATTDKNHYCAAMVKCLDTKPSDCSEADFKPAAKIKYDAEYCEPFKEMQARGLKAGTKVGREVYTKLAGDYRVIYESKGTLQATADMMAFLFDNMSFTAKLINAYKDASYDLHYTSKDRKKFAGSNGRSLSGTFTWALQDSAGTKLGLRNVFMGYGSAQVLKWKLHGSAVAVLDLDPKKDGTMKYRLRAIVFPGNSVLNSIMQMRIFKAVVGDKIDHIVSDIVSSAKSFADGNRKPIQKSKDFEAGEMKQTMELFNQVTEGKLKWQLGDWQNHEGLRNGTKAKP